MPSAAEHYAWAQQNEAFYSQLGGSQSQQPDWAMTILYYVAVHEIEAALVSVGVVVFSHERRKAKMQAKWPPIRRLHDALYDRSRNARYRCYRPTADDLSDAERVLRELRAEIGKLNLPPY